MYNIAIVTTMFSSIHNWVEPFLDHYNRNDIQVTIICNMDKESENSIKERYPFVKTHFIPFPRGVSIFKSIKSYLALKRFLKQNRFDLIQYSTPNASFYASRASKKAKIPVRLYCQWGMVFMSMKGIKRLFFKHLEKLICKWSTDVQPDSRGNLNFCINNGFYNSKKGQLILNGSAKGVDLSKYDITKKDSYKSEIRKKYGISPDDYVIGFVGRLGADKGVHELLGAFKELQKTNKKVKLLFVGPLEKPKTLKREDLDYFLNNSDIIKTGRIDFVEKAVCAMDVFTLPSYREGFGMSVLEASAMEIPVVVTRFPGPGDTAVDGVTGFFCDIKNTEQLLDGIKKLINNPELSKCLGENGREFVAKNFEQKEFIEQTIKNRLLLLQKNKEL